MPWIYLILAGLFEIGWPVGFKIAQNDGDKFRGIMIALVCMTLSGILLYIAQKTIPIGTAYAVWTGIGAAGTFFIGVHFYNDPAGILNYIGIACIVLGVTLLKA
jgi:quaternary ammonium compound-resistance protein SugE